MKERLFLSRISGEFGWPMSSGAWKKLIDHLLECVCSTTSTIPALAPRCETHIIQRVAFDDQALSESPIGKTYATEAKRHRKFEEFGSRHRGSQLMLPQKSRKCIFLNSFPGF
jgi:hypothetical protein